MDVILIALGLASVGYGLSVMLVWSGSSFFAVWYAIGVALAGAGLAMRMGAWQQLPHALRLAAGVVAGAALAVTLAVAALILTTASEPTPAALDEVIVLGAQVRADGSPSTVLRYRLDTAVDYLRDNPTTRVVVSGGKGPNELCTEAEAMARYLESKGVDASRIVPEDASTTTVENLRYSKALLGSADDEVGIVTNDFHVLRATRIAARQGYAHAHGIAAPSDAWYVPNNVLREVMGVVKDALLGNM